MVVKQPNLKPSEELFYILGVILGDGTVSCDNRRNDSKNYWVGLLQTRKEFADSFESALRKIGLNPCRFMEKRPLPAKKTQYGVRANSVVFYKWYKTLTLTDIRQMLLENGKFVPFLIKGFYESEGNISYYKPGHKRVSLYNHNQRLLELIKELSTRLGFKSTLHGRPNKYGFRPSERFRWELRVVGNPQTNRFIELVHPEIKKEVGD